MKTADITKACEVDLGNLFHATAAHAGIKSKGKTAVQVYTAHLPIEMLNNPTSVEEETFIEVRTSRAPSMQFNRVDKAIQWIKDRREGMGSSCPNYEIHQVTKTVTRTRIDF